MLEAKPSLKPAVIANLDFISDRRRFIFGFIAETSAHKYMYWQVTPSDHYTNEEFYPGRNRILTILVQEQCNLYITVL